MRVLINSIDRIDRIAIYERPLACCSFASFAADGLMGGDAAVRTLVDVDIAKVTQSYF